MIYPIAKVRRVSITFLILYCRLALMIILFKIFCSIDLHRIIQKMLRTLMTFIVKVSKSYIIQYQ